MHFPPYITSSHHPHYITHYTPSLHHSLTSPSLHHTLHSLTTSLPPSLHHSLPSLHHSLPPYITPSPHYITPHATSLSVLGCSYFAFYLLDSALSGNTLQVHALAFIFCTPVSSSIVGCVGFQRNKLLIPSTCSRDPHVAHLPLIW